MNSSPLLSNVVGAGLLVSECLVAVSRLAIGLFRNCLCQSYDLTRTSLRWMLSIFRRKLAARLIICNVLIRGDALPSRQLGLLLAYHRRQSVNSTGITQAFCLRSERVSRPSRAVS
jgi:hypothetical protein